MYVTHIALGERETEWKSTLSTFANKFDVIEFRGSNYDKKTNQTSKIIEHVSCWNQEKNSNLHEMYKMHKKR